MPGRRMSRRADVRRALPVELAQRGFAILDRRDLEPLQLQVLREQLEERSIVLREEDAAAAAGLAEGRLPVHGRMLAIATPSGKRGDAVAWGKCTVARFFSGHASATSWRR